MRFQASERNIEYCVEATGGYCWLALDGFRAGERRWVLGIFSASSMGVKTKNKPNQGWRIRGWFDWSFAVLSFLIFVLLEATLIYSYFVFVRVL